MELVHFKLLELACADCQTRDEGPEFEVTHVTQDDLPERIICTNEIEQKDVELPRRSREIDERRIRKTCNECLVEFWHSRNRNSVFIEKGVAK